MAVATGVVELGVGKVAEGMEGEMVAAAHGVA